MNKQPWLLGPGIVAALAAACGAADDTDGGEADAGAPILTGVYSCSIETIDGYSSCGGPVYTSDLHGQGLTMSLTQTGTALEAGMWGVILTGVLQPDGRVTLLHRDTSCSACSPSRPFVIDVTGIGGVRQVTNISVRMYQIGLDECEKTYRGTCATN